MKPSIGTAALALAVALTGCVNEIPTSTDDELIRVDARSVEVRIPYEEFGADFRILSGFGSAVELSQGVVARNHLDTLNARTLSRFGAFPREAAVRDTTGTTVTDSALTFVGGRVVATLDTARVPDGPVTLRAGALQTGWHAPTVGWELAVDTVARAEPWPEVGGGPVVDLGTATWDPAEGDTLADTLSFAVDSATVAAWGDTTGAAARGVRLSMETEGARVDVRNLQLRLETRPSVNPDTTVVLTVGEEDLTFIYDPVPEPPPDGMRVGGVPAWRTVFRVDLPETLDGPPALCEALGCPFPLEAGSVNFAALVVTSRSSPEAFRPRRSLALDIRPALSPERLPKSPLGSSLVGGIGRELPPRLFAEGGEEEITVPVTRYIRDLVRDEIVAGQRVPSTLTFLTTLEPVSLSVASFFGPGHERAPFLRLILTQDDGVTLP